MLNPSNTAITMSFTKFKVNDIHKNVFTFKWKVLTYTEQEDIAERHVMTEIEEYIQSIDRLAKERSDFTFRNSSPDKAAIVCAKIVEYAKETVYIYDESIDGEIADQHEMFGHVLSDFIRQGKMLKMVLRELKPSEAVFYANLAQLSELYPEQVQVKLANSDFRNNVKDVASKDVNFIVNDNGSYRLENGNQIGNIREAICSFNNTDVTSKLIEIFNYHFDNCSRTIFPAGTTCEIV